MRTISQSELRNDNAEVIRGLERGETYTITRRGVPVARLVPINDASDLRCDRRAQAANLERRISGAVDDSFR